MIITNYLGKLIRFTDERIEHILGNHPEMNNQMANIEETLIYPDTIVRSVTDCEVQPYYKYYDKRPVTRKYLCVVLKVLDGGAFIITTRTRFVGTDPSGLFAEPEGRG